MSPVRGFIFGRAYYRKDICVLDWGGGGGWGLFSGGRFVLWGLGEGLLSEGYLRLRLGGWGLFSGGRLFCGGWGRAYYRKDICV